MPNIESRHCCTIKNLISNTLHHSRHPAKPCRAMCDAQAEFCCTPDASLLISGPDFHSSVPEIAQHEYLPTSRGHDPPAVHHGPAAEDPCHSIMQRYLPFVVNLGPPNGVCAFTQLLREHSYEPCFSVCSASSGCAMLLYSIDRPLLHALGAASLLSSRRLYSKCMIVILPEHVVQCRNLNADAGAVCSGFHLPLSGHLHTLRFAVSSCTLQYYKET